MGKINGAIYSSKSDEWATPQEIFDELDREFHFDLDPCATSSNRKCENFYTLQENGLSHSWGVQSLLQSPIQRGGQVGREVLPGRN